MDLCVRDIASETVISNNVTLVFSQQAYVYVAMIGIMSFLIRSLLYSVSESVCK